MAEPLRILFTAPAYHPATAFGGPIVMARELNEGMVRRGHVVDVLTTTLTDVRSGRTYRGRTADVGGVTVHYLAAPLRYRWMGVTPSLPAALVRLPRPDVVHVFGFRDPLGTATALWCRARGIPYVLEPLGMFEPRVRKIRLKQLLDRTLLRPVTDGAAVIVATSEIERRAIVAAGAPADRVYVRGNGFPQPPLPADGRLRRELGLERDTPLVLYVGRIAAGKGIEFLLDAARVTDAAHFAFVGPDDGHGISARVRAAADDAATRGRIHSLGSRADALALYGDADLFVLPSEGESFGMVAAEAAAAGTPVVVTDRCGVAEFLDGAAVVVPATAGAISEAVVSTLRDTELREQLAAAARETAERNSWPRIVERQEELYRIAIAP